MSQLSDIEIIDLSTPRMPGRHGLIEPFLSEQVRQIENPSHFIPDLPGFNGFNRRLNPDRRTDSSTPLNGDDRTHERRLMRPKIKAISAGVSSYGYDFRLSPKSFKVFHNSLGVRLVDPKNFDERLLIPQEPSVDETGTWFVVPGNNYALCETVEYVRMPRELMAVSVGKSTYARCGLITNVTPFEAGWHGIVTLELANASPAPLKVYANEGICQTMFFRGDHVPMTTYADRDGKYQGQTGLTLPRA